MGATKDLATYVVSAQLDTIPQDVRHEAHRALLNYVGCAVGGSREPAVDIDADEPELGAHVCLPHAAGDA